MFNESFSDQLFLEVLEEDISEGDIEAIVKAKNLYGSCMNTSKSISNLRKVSLKQKLSHIYIYEQHTNIPYSVFLHSQNHQLFSIFSQ